MVLAMWVTQEHKLLTQLTQHPKQNIAMWKETNKILIICLFIIMNIQFISPVNGQNLSFDKIKWENDKFGKFGDRVKMMQLDNFQFPISEDKLIDYSLTQFVDVMGQPDLKCEYQNDEILIWYLEG